MLVWIDGVSLKLILVLKKGEVDDVRSVGCLAGDSEKRFWSFDLECSSRLICVFCERNGIPREASDMMRNAGIAARYVLSRLWTRKPLILTHSVTSKCNCRCKICDVWRKKPNDDEMSTREIFRLLDEARDLNFVAYVAWGGEPLMRPDILEILQHARDKKLYTIIITNGVYLPRKAERLAELAELTLVSLDHHTDYHDEMRGVRGTFDKTVKGIATLRHMGGRAAINCVLSKLNIDDIERITKLASRLGVSIAFDPMEVFQGYNEAYSLSRGEVRRAFSEISSLKRRGYPILNSREYVDHSVNRVKYSCAQPLIFVMVTEDGEVKPFWCQRTRKVLGDLQNQSLGEVIDSRAFRQFSKIAKNCSLCGNSTTVETSIFYSTIRFFSNCHKWNNPYLRFISDYAL